MRFAQKPEAKQRARDRYLKCKEANPLWQREKKLKKYGLTLLDYDRMLREQNGGCAICGGSPDVHKYFHVDHDHVTGIVRGLLCQACNTGIGKLRDDPSLLRRATAYLERARG